VKALVWGLAAAGILAVGWILLHEPWHPAFCWDCVLRKSHRHRGGERPQSASLKTLASAQADFRANDRDGDGKQEFWRGDVAGLYLLRPPGDPRMIQLIEVSVAGADAAPILGLTRTTAKAPKAGYWFKAIRHADETPGRLNPDRFAFCAYPDDPAAHRFMFVISEGNTIFKAPAVKDGVDVFPDDATLRTKWAKLD
jgi:hypothetical protein